MSIGRFVWTDLSTYDMQAARSDYAALFGWNLQGDPQYDFATRNGREVAALFPMPSRLAKIDMPSFWMSYVHVENVEETIERARTHDGVVIEVEPQPFNESGRVALVRDPSGAGFTVYEGPDIAPASQGHGTVQRRYHHVDDVDRIRAFYADLFGWTLVKTAEQPWPAFDVRHPDGSIVARIEETPESIRGKFKYWMPCFDVGALDGFSRLVAKTGGEVLSDLPGNRKMFADRQGAHFMARAEAPIRQPQNEASRYPASPPRQRFAWKAVLGLACVWLAVIFDIQAFWGVLFLIWTWPALKTGRADFIDPISRVNRPIMYWAIIGTWVALSLWLIAIAIGGSTS